MTQTSVTEPVIFLTDKAVDKAVEFMDRDGTGALRVGVKGGGCSGFQYVLALDEQHDGDVVWEQDGVMVLCLTTRTTLRKVASCSKTLMPLQAADAALLLGWTPKKDAIPSRRFSRSR